MLAHAACFTVALFLCFLVDSGMRIGEWFPRVFLAWLGVTLAVKLIVYGLLHQFQGWWRYASVPDLLGIIKGSYISTIILFVIWWGSMWLIPSHMGIYERVPQSVMLMDLAATIIVLCGVRLAIRLYYEETHTVAEGRLSRLLIVGAGNAGEVLLREIQRMATANYEVIGFIDDDPRKLKARIYGVSVLGSTEQIKEIAAESNVDEIVIAMPSATHQQIRRVINLCQGANLKFSTVPDLVAIASGKVKVSQIREVDINDLLGRDPVTLDTDMIRNFLTGKVILITGAGGSIGSEMCRQIAQFEPKALVLIEQAENCLFDIDRELARRFSHLTIHKHICDITDRPRVNYIFATYRPEVVIHAAAHKHVPLMEIDPGEAVKNNILGTRNVALAADQYGVGHFVMISTDKAVNPTSIMGSTKRIAEMSIQCLNERSKTDFVTVRFGNVLGSNGSVIPIFKQQIAAGGPVTVTHPEMRRYFMTIPEASQLVLQAATMGHGGEIFVLDMGEPVKIVDLARDMITLSGFRVGEDIDIEFTGMRPGEKLFEELSIRGENMAPTRHPKIGIWKNIPTNENLINETVEELLRIANCGDHKHIVQLIKKIVPEYVGDVDFMKLHTEHQARCNGETPADIHARPSA
ncbi:MAG: polysaccharide biosynthesis protein [Sedimentisphaerales bacterium]|nr:polysaccharide biosynthesis protein [Sedimentisphaerales bacterium]